MFGYFDLLDFLRLRSRLLASDEAVLSEAKSAEFGPVRFYFNAVAFALLPFGILSFFLNRVLWEPFSDGRVPELQLIARSYYNLLVPVGMALGLAVFFVVGPPILRRIANRLNTSEDMRRVYALCMSAHTFVTLMIGTATIALTQLKWVFFTRALETSSAVPVTLMNLFNVIQLMAVAAILYAMLITAPWRALSITSSSSSPVKVGILVLHGLAVAISSYMFNKLFAAGGFFVAGFLAGAELQIKDIIAGLL